MTKMTAAYVVAEGTTMLEGRPVKAGDPITMTPAQALYHVSLGRLEPKDVAKPKAQAKGAPSGSKTPSDRSPGDSSEGSAD